jgi:uncharacterized protein (TIGR02246 family)
MKRILLLALLTIVPQIARAQDTVPLHASSGDRSAEDEIRRLNAEEVDALMRHDVEALTRIWSGDFVVTNPANRFAHRDQVVALVKSGFIAFTSYDRHVDYVHVYGDAAVAAGTETVAWAGTNPAAGKTSELRFTSVWIERDGQWREVARHANVVSGAQLTPPAARAP